AVHAPAPAIPARLSAFVRHLEVHLQQGGALA
ncbi:MAG: hypothetical protein VW891_16430, partial [Novosphingobium sp.]